MKTAERPLDAFEAAHLEFFSSGVSGMPNLNQQQTFTQVKSLDDPWAQRAVAKGSPAPLEQVAADSIALAGPAGVNGLGACGLCNGPVRTTSQ